MPNSITSSPPQCSSWAPAQPIDSPAFVPLAKLGLSIVSGFRLDAKEGAENIHKEMDEWAHRIQLRNKA